MSDWTTLDTWIALTAAIAGMTCALPGTMLVLRKQSMLGDALSHTVLPGIVIAFLLANHFGIGHSGDDGVAWQRPLLLVGAVCSALLTSLLTEFVRKKGKVDDSAALGIVYSSFFAAGLLMIRLFADSTHLDPDCILFGAVETAVLDTWGDTSIPSAVLENLILLGLNSALVVVCFKEIRLIAFDPNLAESLGLKSSVVTYSMLTVTSLSLVAAFESVGLVLVVTVLVVPPAAALLMTDRLSHVFFWAVAMAGGAGVLGHVAAITVPNFILQMSGFDGDSDSSTAGMAAVVCGVMFLAAFLFGRSHGVVTRQLRSIPASTEPR